MAVVNFKLTKVTGEKRDKVSKKTTVKANSAIESVKKDKAEGVGEYLHINFKYEVKYDPDIGEIVLDGNLWYTSPKLKDMMEDGKDKIQLKNEAVQEISTSIIRECLLESLDIAKKLRLPLPINLPSVEIKSKTVDFKKAT
ncbi:MAG: hypothetical protein FJY77_02490 [Candidatus Altiarchaeales archaeon]|nr:hypothetical protein [Candidatus Altiarchaeales archaeon]